MELVAELKGRDGQTRSVRVPCPAEEGEGEQLRGLRRGLAELQQRVAELLAPLVQEEREAAGGGGPRGEADDDDDDDDEELEDEDENCTDAKASAEDPPPKRTKVQQP
ncbi:EKC/KEOPS complex subunit GON7 isoform X1 [Falco biarmicus]|uniref:EKC/KEOPS complex subunit GON7 isoform X1 n=1 Tax=Falco biarmicus TaxID=345155 RepID=UPI0024BD3A6B|nr:EKC/KEOPS complex subunit GON7 isoform X1 [Falco biarmicus]